MKNKKILVIGTDEKVHASLNTLLSPLQYSVVSAATYARAEEIISQDARFQAAVVALDIPKKIEEAVDLAIKNDIPAIVLSGSEDEAFRTKILQEDIVDYVSKEKKGHLQDVVALITQLEQNRKNKILVVDDSRSFRLFMTELLKTHCFTTLEAVNGLEALDVVQNNTDIKLIITDQEMPEMNGLEMIGQIRKHYSTTQLPIIVVSTIGQKSTVAKCLKNGANDYLHKPFEREEFFSRIYLTLSHKENIDAVNKQKRLLEKLSRELDEKVQQRTHELQVAYDELEEHKKHLETRVAQEVEKNRKQTSHMLQQSRLAQMGEMISMIAHQWRQPLASISAISGTLAIDVMMDAYKKEFFEDRLATIDKLSQHLSGTIDDFRNFFKKTKEREPTNWKAIAQGSLNIIGPTLATKSITVHTALQDDGLISTYPNEVKQVVLNIIKNAEEVLLEKKIPDAQIWLKTGADTEHTRLSIEDNAGGIPENIIDRIFDPYFSTKKKKDGTGLGLYMSKTIIEDHCGGRLGVHNTDRGALFEIVLPLQTKEYA